MKSSGSVWFVYGVAVVVTFLVGLISFAVFVLAQVFGSGGENEPGPVVQGQPTVTPTATATPVARTTLVRVYEVRAVVADKRQVVLIVATPVGCTNFLRAAAYAEGPGAVAVRVTQQAYRADCKWQRKPVLATARAPIAARTLIVNGVVWTADAEGRYAPALRSSGSPNSAMWTGSPVSRERFAAMPTATLRRPSR
ncbi:hypothetical protein EV643_10955 [Kribbella sp. VKM Ac-2527]|uniref:Uncharacterized protein n=1 Tax=Kribbella caucasensis TaxID=2512215 RepID=A0A4R6KCN3_9ACTN|nr:hypothetical protein EV643_10955 [Kribbella sp. VKM Ac-2527]